MDYDPNTTAVVVVDCQNDFCHPEGALYAEGSEEAISGVNRVLEVANKRGMDVWFTLDTHQEGDPEFEQWGEHCLRGSWGAHVHDAVEKPGHAFHVEKNTYDAFHKTSFDSRLSDYGTETLIICGTLANVCVQETASSAALHDYNVIVVEDAVGYITEEQRDAALSHIDFLIGETVSTVDL